MTNRIYIGDSSVSWEMGSRIDPEISSLVLHIYGVLKKKIKTLPGVVDIVPSYKSVTVHFDPFTSDIDECSDKIEKIINSEKKNYSPGDTKDSREVILPVIYDGEDVGRIAELHGLKERDVIRIHSSGLYRIAMIGFKPYFPYLMGLDESLITPRLETPRVKVPAGSVAIGGEQTGIYPEDSPGGWNIIGRTSPELLRNLRPGDIIKFEERKEL